jgi:hypothetical protein
MPLFNNTDEAISIPKHINMGQIAVLNITNKGSAYVAVPTVAIAAPNSGVQATATAVMELSDVASVAAGGTGYVAGEILTLAGGTGTAATINVLTVTTGGVVATVSIKTRGAYTVLPSSLSTAAVTGGSGANATFSVNFRLKSITITNPGKGYVANDAAGVTFNPASTSAATAVKRLNTFISGGQDANKSIIFVSKEEASLTANKAKGLTSPGWWSYKTYTDADGNVRQKSELLVAMTVANSVSGDTGAFVVPDDTIVADVNATVTIGTAPANQYVSSGAATFSVSATASNSGSLEYQWQRKVPNGRFVNISNETNSTLVLSDQTLANTGTQYRVVVGSSIGANKVTSSSATLTFRPTYISVQPVNVNTSEGGATLTVTAVAPSGTKSYQWQQRAVGGTTWTNVGTDSATLSLTGLSASKEIRVTVSNDNLDPDVVSTTATVTYVS